MSGGRDKNINSKKILETLKQQRSGASSVMVVLSVVRWGVGEGYAVLIFSKFAG